MFSILRGQMFFSPRMGRWIVATGGAMPSFGVAEPVEDDLIFSPRRGEGDFRLRVHDCTFQTDERPAMPGTYSQILLHIVFGTKRRQMCITPDIADRLYPYMGGIVRAERGILYDIGGIEDHVHMYLRWRPDESLSNLMRAVKARSSKWVHETFPTLGTFAWQEGYSAFSVSKSQEDAVKKYIAGQVEHHKKEDFQTELLRFLMAHGIEFDERYVFD
jgi:putative transposase